MHANLHLIYYTRKCIKFTSSLSNLEVITLFFNQLLLNEVVKCLFMVKQQARELISNQKLSHKHNNMDLSHLW